MTETRILLLRHAETAAPDRFHGAESDIGLGARGRLQADAAAQVLAADQPVAVYSSSMRRAIETAEPIARACGLIPIIEPDLHERRMGPLSGLTRAEGLAAYAEAKSRWVAGQIDYTHEGGESYAAIRQRVVPIFQRLARSWSDQTIVIIAHGVVIRVLLTSILPGHGPRDFDRFAIDNTAVNDLRFDGDQWTAAALNRPLGPRFDSFAW